jgi:saccharopine dehydrogenase-like NADP-dependent oxidoreductase
VFETKYKIVVSRVFVLGGYGEMGKVAVIDLFETCKDCEIIVGGHNLEKAKAFAKKFHSKRVKAVFADAENVKQLAKALKGSVVVINAVQYYYNLHVMKAALAAGVHYIDLGGLFHMTRKQLKLHKEFKRKNLLAVLGMGATPGITNVMAAYGAKKFDKVNEIHIAFADKDWTKYDKPFVVPYSMYTVFDEFTKPPAIFTKGKLKFVEPMSGYKYIPFPKPIYKANCFYTLHSEVATLPSSFKLKECSFRGGFDPDFVAKVKFLIDAGFASKEAIDFTVKLLNRFIPSEKIKINDLEYLRVELKGIKDGRKQARVVYCKAVTNKKWNISAGSWDTGVPPSIVAQMLLKKQIDARGALPPELCIPQKIFFQELQKRNIEIFEAAK